MGERTLLMFQNTQWQTLHSFECLLVFHADKLRFGVTLQNYGTKHMYN